jgi:hypothetical protein
MKRALQLKMVDPRKHSEAKLARMADIVRERVRRERREAAEAEKKAAEEEKRAKAMPHVNGIAKADESGPPLVVKTESGLVVKTESAGSSGAPATPAPPKEPEPKKVEPPSDEAIAEMQEELETLQHKNPTFHGDTIYAETRVLDTRESSKGDRGIVTVETKGFNQDGVEVCYFRRKVMVWKRDTAPTRKRPYGDDVWE